MESTDPKEFSSSHCAGHPDGIWVSRRVVWRFWGALTHPAWPPESSKTLSDPVPPCLPHPHLTGVWNGSRCSHANSWIPSVCLLTAESLPKSPRCEALWFASVVDQQMFAAGAREAVSMAHVDFGALWLKCNWEKQQQSCCLEFSGCPALSYRQCWQENKWVSNDHKYIWTSKLIGSF